MFTYHPTYSVQRNGDRGRVCVTINDTAGVATTTVLTTLTIDLADQLTRQLATVADRRDDVLREHARNHPGSVCHQRRAAMAAVTSGRRDATVAHLEPLLELTDQLTRAQLNSLTDEIGRLYDGTDDTIVPVDLTDEFGGLLWTTFANDWLRTENWDEALADMLADYLSDGSSHILYEGLLAHLRASDPDIEGALEGTWIDVTVDNDALLAWLNRHQPDLVEGFIDPDEDDDTD